MGKWFHTFYPETGRIEYQGKVVSNDGRRIRAQLFSWITGFPTDIRTFPAEDAKTWQFYKTAQAWRDAGDRAFL